jgi:1,4-dihydroxy-2-naphthoate octaprenyltransferase
MTQTAETTRTAETTSQTDLWRGLWRLADPKITLTSMAAIFLGACAAAVDGPLHWGWLVVTVLAYFCMETAKNASGEIIDWDSGADQRVPPEDRTNFSGGKRVLVDELLTRRQTIVIALIFYGVGLAAGAAIVFLREPWAFWIGVVGAALAYSYHGPPLKLAYHGLGEITVLLTYGPLTVGAAYLIQRGTLPLDVLLLGLPLGILIAGFLWVNQFPDYPADRAVGKRNLVVRLGRVRASRVFPFIVGAAFLIVALLPLTGQPLTVWLAGLGALPAAYAATMLIRYPETFHRFASVQPAMLLSFLIYALGGGVGLLLG